MRLSKIRAAVRLKIIKLNRKWRTGTKRRRSYHLREKGNEWKSWRIWISHRSVTQQGKQVVIRITGQVEIGTWGSLNRQRRNHNRLRVSISIIRMRRWVSPWRRHRGMNGPKLHSNGRHPNGTKINTRMRKRCHKSNFKSQMMVRLHPCIAAYLSAR